MEITNEAKKLLEEALAEQDADGIRFHTSRSCCGTSLQLETVKITAGDEPEDINGLSVLMDEETHAWTGTVTIDVENGRLSIHDTASCCG